MKTRHFLSSIWSPSRIRSGSLSHSWAWLSAGMLNQIPPASLASYLLSQCGTSRSVLGTTKDIRRLCDLFGLSVKGAERYLATTTAR